MADNDDIVSRTFRALVESADRKFARVRDLPAYGRSHEQHYFHKVFKAYTRLWKYQQEHRTALVRTGLNRWEIGEIASRIGQLYFSQYMRTSETRFLLEAFIFYEAILNRNYFEGSKVKDLGVRFKELRFYARFLLVSLILSRTDMVKVLVERLGALIDDCKANFRQETHFREWKLVSQEITRFMNADLAFTMQSATRPLRYCAELDSHPSSLPFVARFHAKKILKFQDAVIMSYHRNEVKFAELTLDAYRMLQSLEWEPSGSFYQKRSVEPKENGVAADHSAASGFIDIKLAADMSDPTLPSNPRKAVLYRPSVTHLIAVMATISEELPPESIMLIYISASGKADRVSNFNVDAPVGSRRTSRNNVFSHTSAEQNSAEFHTNGKVASNEYYGDHLWLGPKGNKGSNNLYPGDLIPFTRRPVFLIIDSDSSHAFKVLHGAERGEKAAILLSPLKAAFKRSSHADITQFGSQFTHFLTAPLEAFLQMVDFSLPDAEAEVLDDAEKILSSAFAEWEQILCTSASLDLVWAQVLPDPLLRRLILRFVFCRTAFALFCPPEEGDQFLPICLPQLPNSVAPKSEVVQSAVVRLAAKLKVTKSFHFGG